jgi:hypothetical protein
MLDVNCHKSQADREFVRWRDLQWGISHVRERIAEPLDIGSGRSCALRESRRRRAVQLRHGLWLLQLQALRAETAKSALA